MEGDVIRRDYANLFRHRPPSSLPARAKRRIRRDRVCHFLSLIEPEEAARRVIAERVVTEFAYKWYREMESREEEEGEGEERDDKSTSREFIG